MTSEKLPAQRLEHAQTKLQDALSSLKLAGEELAIVEASMIGGPRGFREMTSLSSIAQEIKATLTPFTQDQRDQILEFVFEELCKDCGGTWNGIDVEPAKRCRCIIW